MKTSNMKKNILMLSIFTIGLIFLAGCQSTEMVEQNNIELVRDKLAKPGTIYVYNFIINRADIPVDSSLTSMNPPNAPPQSAEEISVGTKLGQNIAQDLVEDINDMGMNAAIGTSATKPQLNDIVIRGYLVSVYSGSGAERVFIGFGYGSSELMTVVEGYQMTPEGLKKLSAGKIESIGGKMPGAGLGAASWIIFGNPLGLIIGLGVKTVGEITGSNTIVGLADSSAGAISKKLKVAFQNQGWIEK